MSCIEKSMSPRAGKAELRAFLLRRHKAPGRWIRKVFCVIVQGCKLWKLNHKGILMNQRRTWNRQLLQRLRRLTNNFPKERTRWYSRGGTKPVDKKPENR